jgi:hypothetical protein
MPTKSITQPTAGALMTRWYERAARYLETLDRPDARKLRLAETALIKCIGPAAAGQYMRVATAELQRLQPKSDDARGYTLDVQFGVDAHGNPRPELRINGLELVHKRTVRAAMHTLAAALEADCIGTTEQWSVHVLQTGDYEGRVYLGLLDVGDEHEAERGMDRLAAVAAKHEAGAQ